MSKAKGCWKVPSWEGIWAGSNKIRNSHWLNKLDMPLARILSQFLWDNYQRTLWTDNHIRSSSKSTLNIMDGMQRSANEEQIKGMLFRWDFNVIFIITCKHFWLNLKRPVKANCSMSKRASCPYRSWVWALSFIEWCLKFGQKCHATRISQQAHSDSWWKPSNRSTTKPILMLKAR